MTHAKSVFESEARAVKVRALCRAIDHDIAHGLGAALPVIDAHTIAGFIRSRDDDWWATLAKLHSIRTPSAVTIEAVCLEYESRASDETEREEPNAAELAEIASW